MLILLEYIRQQVSLMSPWDKVPSPSINATMRSVKLEETGDVEDDRKIDKSAILKTGFRETQGF